MNDFDRKHLWHPYTSMTLPLPVFAAFHEASGITIIDGLGSTEMIHIFVSAEGNGIRPGATNA